MSSQQPVTESANDLMLRSNLQMAKRLQKNVLIPRGKLQRKNCWTLKENNCFIDTMVRGWACTPIYIIRRIDDEEDEEIYRDEVFDGAHKLEAAFNFIENKFPLEKNEKSILSDYGGKTFKELPLPIRQKILNYPFTINYIDEETANDSESLKLLWSRLNKEGKKLNDFELALPSIHELVHTILNPSLPLFLDSIIFPKKVSVRGAAEKILQLILATAEYDIHSNHLKKFSSKKALIKQWQDECLGDKISAINEKIKENSEKWLGILKLGSHYLGYLEENGCFTNEDTGDCILDSAHRGTESVFLLGRCLYHFPKADTFRRICPALSKFIREKYFTEQKDGIWVTKVIRNEAGRNGLLQSKLLRDIDADVLAFVDENQRRKFSPEMIEQKLKEQAGICTYCKKPILKNQAFEGDHIIPWSKGGKTEYTNLQVLHRKCNKEKGAST